MRVGRGAAVGSSLSQWGVWGGEVGGVAGPCPGLGAAGGKVLSPGHGMDNGRREEAGPVTGLGWPGLQGGVVSQRRGLRGWRGQGAGEEHRQHEGRARPGLWP